MKQLSTILAIFAFVISSFGVSFDWGTGPVKSSFGGVPATDGSIMGYLVYLGNSSDSTYNILDFTVNNSVVGQKPSSSTGTNAGKGRIRSTIDIALGAQLPNTTAIMQNGAVFGMFVTKDVDGKTYVNVSSNTYTLSGVADDGTVLDAVTFAFNWDAAAEGAPLTAGGGWATAPTPDVPEPPVPEPATAGVALLGLAMLFKRRKA